MEKKLQKDPHHKMIAGVCAGLAEYLNIDVTIVRIVFLLTLILHGGGFLLYAVLWIVLPKKVYAFNDPNVDYKVPPFGDAMPFGAMPPQNPGFNFTGDLAHPHRSSATIIIGTILIIIGGYFLLDEFDIIPDWDFGRLWPVTLIVAGLAVMLAQGKKQPWEHANWHNTNTTKSEETINDNPTTL